MIDALNQSFRLVRVGQTNLSGLRAGCRQSYGSGAGSDSQRRGAAGHRRFMRAVPVGDSLDRVPGLQNMRKSRSLRGLPSQIPQSLRVRPLRRPLFEHDEGLARFVQVPGRRGRRDGVGGDARVRLRTDYGRRRPFVSWNHFRPAGA